MDKPLTKENIQNHFHYGWWKYAVMAICVLVGLNLFFTTTRYRAPRHLRVDWYISSSGANQEALLAYMEEARLLIMPDMEEVNCVVMMTNDGSDPYAGMQLSTFLMAGEGTIYLLNANDFKAYASQGVMLALDDYITAGDLNTGDLDLSGGIISRRESDDDPYVTALLGIPADEMFGLWDFNVDNRGMVFCVASMSGNNENAVKMLDYMVQTLTKPMPVPDGN